MKIPYVNIAKQYSTERKDLLYKIDRTLSSGNWIGGGEIEKFEKKISKLCKTKYCVALNSGTDALTLGLHLLGVRRGDEVITPPKSKSTAVIIGFEHRTDFDLCHTALMRNYPPMRTNLSTWHLNISLPCTSALGSTRLTETSLKT